MYIDDEKVLIRMERSTYNHEKRDFKCKNCGSNYFKMDGEWIQCKFCKAICKKNVYDKKETHNQDYHVIKGPNTICNSRGVKGFFIPPHKFAIARLGYSDRGIMDMLAQFSVLFDDKIAAEKLAKAMRIKRKEKTVKKTMPLTNEMYEPKGMARFLDVREVFDFRVVNLSEVNFAEENILDRERIVMFSCGPCGSHRTINTEYNKNFKIKEPCARCGMLIKAQIVG